jgi:hypothetical protein
VSFRGGPYPALDPAEPLLPPDVAAWPQVVFSTGDSWSAVVQAYRTVVEQRLAGSALAEIVGPVVRAEDSVTDRVKKLSAWVREHVHYAGVEFGSSQILPAPPLQTARRGYGDCKDQAALLVGLLRAAGVEAHVALLRAGTGDDVRPNLPTLDVFNHVIVVVPGSPATWIDPTATYARAGELPVEDQDRLALVVAPDTVGLTRTPTLGASANSYREVREVHFPDEGNGRIVETSSATGVLEQDLRGDFSGSRSEAKEGLGRYVENTYNTKTPFEYDYPPAIDLERPFVMRIEAKDARVAVADFDTADALIESEVLFDWVPREVTGDRPRQADLVLPAPYRAQLEYQIHPPEGFVATVVPKPTQARLGPASFARTARVREDGVVIVDFSFELPVRRMTPADVEQFRKAWAQRQAEPGLHVSFAHEGRRRLDARRSREGVDLFRRFADQHPSSGIHRMRLAVAVAEVGFGAAARRMAQEAVALQPGSALLQRQLAGILAQYEFGRAYHAGYDRAGALAAYRRAAELEAEDVFSRLQVGVLLEHDDEGIRYGAGAELAAAVQQYDSLDPAQVDAYADGAYANNALTALIYARRFRDAQERMGKAPRDQVPAVPAIVVAAALGGPNGGLSEAVRLDLSGPAQTEALTEASRWLARLRMYPEAAALAEPAGHGASDAVELQSTARMLQKLRAVDPAAMPLRTPADVVKKAFVLYASEASVPSATAHALVSDRAFGANGWAPAVALLEATNGMAAEVRGAPRFLFGDLIASALSTTVEGSDAVGHRVKVRASIPPHETHFDVFVVREQGVYRIRAFGEHVSELGAEALHWATSGDLPRARQWLVWARELVESPGGEDPLRLSPFLTLWADGKGQPALAAAALCAEGSKADQAIAILEAAAQGARPEQRLVLDHALAVAYENSTQYAKQLTTAERLEHAYPGSQIARRLKLGALWRLRRYADYRAAVLGYLQQKPEDPGLLEDLSEAEDALGHLPEAQRLCERVIAAGAATARTYNQQAWRSLFIGTVRDQDLGYALRAVQIARNVTHLHTLAAVYAELGRLEDARQMLSEVLAARVGERPIEIDYYLIGRLAEQFSLPDVAREAYGRVSAPQPDYATSTYRLTQSRLAHLPR